VHDKAKSIALGIEQRDSAIKAGAKGATTVIVAGKDWSCLPTIILTRSAQT